MTSQTKILIKKIIIVCAIAILVAVAFFALIWVFGLWDFIRDVERVKDFIKSYGTFSIIIYGIFVILQVVILPIPSTVTNLVAALLFEPWVNFIVTSICTIIGSFICFFIGRIFGKKIVTWLIGEDKTSEYSNLLVEKGSLLFVLMLILPCFPDDVLCMVAGLSSMSLGYFAIATLLTRPIMIAIVSFFGDAAINAIGTWGIPVSIGVVILIMIPVIIVLKKARTNKDDSHNNNHND